MGAAFQKIVAIEPVRLPESFCRELESLAEEVELYPDSPVGDAETIRRIGDADAVLVSFSTPVGRAVLEACPNLRYVGMCCSLYSPESANVDILAAEGLGIAVAGVRDYGDEGVPEYVISELTRLLHGFGGTLFGEAPMELTGLKVGVLGLGTSGQMVARALRFFGADVLYYSRTRKKVLETRFGYQYLPLEELLPRAVAVCACLNRGSVLLGEREFGLLGDHKILINTSIAPGHDVAAAEKWLEHPGNYLLSDTAAGIGPERLLELPNVLCPNRSAGMTTLAADRLGRKVVNNIKAFLAG